MIQVGNLPVNLIVDGPWPPGSTTRRVRSLSSNLSTNWWSKSHGNDDPARPGQRTVTPGVLALAQAASASQAQPKRRLRASASDRAPSGTVPGPAPAV
jgi:hypothetical protein